jgi:hypothetical protein
MLTQNNRESSSVGSIIRTTDALLASVSAALKRVPGADYDDSEVFTAFVHCHVTAISVSVSVSSYLYPLESAWLTVL